MIDECGPASSLRVVVPAYTGEIKAEACLTLCEGVRMLTAMGMPVAVDIKAGCAWVDMARNVLLAGLLCSDASDLLFVDSDVAVEPEAFVRIALARKPVIGGIYPKRGDNAGWPVGEVLGREGDLVEVSFLPAGFLRINKAAAVEMATIVPIGPEQGGPVPMWFRAGLDGGQFVGEDVQFCRQWRAIGGKCWAMPGLKFSHTGPKTWRGEWHGNGA